MACPVENESYAHEASRVPADDPTWAKLVRTAGARDDREDLSDVVRCAQVQAARRRLRFAEHGLEPPRVDFPAPTTGNATTCDAVPGALR